MTQRAFLVGTIGLCFYLISVTNALPAAFSVLTWLALSLLIASAAVALLSLQGLKCRFRVTRSGGAAPWPNQKIETENDLAPQLEVRLGNGGTLNKTGLILTVKLRVESAVNETETRHGAAREYSRRFVVEALTANKSLTALLPLNELPRGVYRVEEIRITGSDVLGLFRVIGRYRAEKCGEGALRIKVAPAYLEARGASTRGETEGARRGERGSDDELRGTRPYVAGDDLRAVHWKTTARLGRLVVREFDATARRRAFVIWDGIAAPIEAASTRAASEARATENAVEQSLRLAMSLCAALGARGDECVLLRMDAQPQRVASGRAGFLTRCGETLCVAAPNRTAPLASSALLKTRGAIARGDELFVVAPRADASLLKLAAWSAQGVAVTVALLESAAPRASTRAAKKAQRQNAASSFVAVPDSVDSAITDAVSTAPDGAASAVSNAAAPNGDDSVASNASSPTEKSSDNARSSDADSAAANAISATENRFDGARSDGAAFATNRAATAPASTRKRIFPNLRRDETAAAREKVIEDGAPLFGEATRDFAAQLRAAGARVVVVEASGEVRATIENAMSELLLASGAPRRGARKSADARAALAETTMPREAVS